MLYEMSAMIRSILFRSSTQYEQSLETFSSLWLLTTHLIQHFVHENLANQLICFLIRDFLSIPVPTPIFHMLLLLKMKKFCGQILYFGDYKFCCDLV